MFNGRKAVLYGLLVLLGCQLVAELVVIRFLVMPGHGAWGTRRTVTRVLSLSSIPDFMLPGCRANGVADVAGRWLGAAFIPMVAFQIVVCVLAVIKSAQTALAQYRASRLMTVLLRDSAMYFGSMLAVSLANVVAFTAVRVRSSRATHLCDGRYF